jgi:hypothetical protein
MRRTSSMVTGLPWAEWLARTTAVGTSPLPRRRPDSGRGRPGWLLRLPRDPHQDAVGQAEELSAAHREDVEAGAALGDVTVHVEYHCHVRAGGLALQRGEVQPRLADGLMA